MKNVSEEEHVDYQLHLLANWKGILFILDCFVLVLGLANFGICLWVRFDLDFREFVFEMDWYSFWYCMYVIMFAMIVAILNTLTSFYGSYVESTGWLTTSIVFYWIAMVFEVIGSIVMLVFGMEESPVLVEELKERFFDLIYAMDYNPRATRILQKIQEYVGCCGANGSEDYIGANKPVPFECRDVVTGNEFGAGCCQGLAWWLEPWTAALVGFALSLLVLHIFQIVATTKLKRLIRICQVSDQEY